ncbi:SET domain-containing protein SmydA-8-like [Sitophilus oryzae]|uniref:SET domain-containing protein SmydA-8-like n=1 Tax=Sitophilus oryzae TaxID=7048 RepID=A0A6J2X6W5_SITOR|nr:SET domain-containing protein SmydA-8-like [Sitophilus oryzae]XP_030746967.1 SET domain-containing protein SmydA-8-like [Sitophilus oryzae]XP_030746968.1 SET domain-containing protein SmydA-8-like [Sitophilus oryzae]
MEGISEEKPCEENKLYEVVFCKETDSFVTATNNIQPGNVILIDNPIVLAPLPTKNDLLCVGCCKRLDETDCYCPKCGWPKCRNECQDVSTHNENECEILRLCPKKSGDSKFRYDILIILRCLLLQTSNKNKWAVLLNLLDRFNGGDRGNADYFKKVEEKKRFLEEVYLKPLRNYEAEIGKSILPQASSDIVEKVCGFLMLYVMEHSNIKLLYAKANLIEQNCVPNAIFVVDDEDDYKMTIKAVQPILKGEHITISYTDILLGTQQRKKYLKKLRNTLCRCSRCEDSTEFNSYLSAMICFGMEDEPCKGIQLSLNPTDETPVWLCNKCNIKLPNKEVTDFIRHLNKEVDKRLETKPNFEDLKDFLEKLELFLHPTHYLIIRVKYHLIQIYEISQTSRDLLKEKMKMCESLIEVFKKIDPGSTRLGLHLLTILSELYKAKTELLFQTFLPEDKDASFSLITEILQILKEANKIAEFQSQIHPQKNLLENVKNNKDMISKWLAENSFMFEID